MRLQNTISPLNVRFVYNILVRKYAYSIFQYAYMTSRYYLRSAFYVYHTLIMYIYCLINPALITLTQSVYYYYVLKMKIS